MTQTEAKSKRFQWRSRSEHALFFITYLLDWGLFNFLIYETPNLNPDQEPTLIHLFVVIIVLGSPVLFFQTFVGQYCRRGCIFLGEMLPVAFGLGYSMLLLSFVRFTYSLFYTLKILEYLLAVALSHRPPWMSCSAGFYKKYPQCFQKEDIDLCPTRAISDNPCFKPKTKLLSAFLYKEHKVFIREEPLTVFTRGVKLIYHSFHVLILLPLLLVFALKGIKSFSVSLRVSTTFCVGALITLFVVAITKPGAQTLLYAMFHEINSESLVDLHTWAVTFRRVIQGLRLAEGGHILFGSFIPESAPDPQRFLYLMIIFCFLVCSTFFYFYSFAGLILFKFGMNTVQLDLATEEHTVFITYPLVLGIHASSYFFSVMNFIVFFFFSFHALVLKVFVMEKTISVQFDIGKYSHYVEVAIILLGMILTYALELTSYYKIIEVIENEFKYFQSCALALQMLVLLTYGLQRMSDDVRFYMHSKVRRFTQLCWVASLIICIDSFTEELTRSPPAHLTIRMIVCVVFCLPFVIFFFIKTFSYIRKRNIIGLLKPSDLYGPPSVEDRVLRILYNPRLVIKCRRLEEICYHNCLLKSSAVQIAVQEEIELIKKFVTDLQSNALDFTLSTRIMSELKMHENALVKGLAKKQLPSS